MPEPCAVGLCPWILWPYVNDQGESSNSETGKWHSDISHRVVFSHIHGVEAQLCHYLFILEWCFAFLFQRK